MSSRWKADAAEKNGWNFYSERMRILNSIRLLRVLLCAFLELNVL